MTKTLATMTMFLLCAPALAVVLVVPTPELPTVFDPAKSLDVFSNNVVRQLHRSLFKLDDGGEPAPDLVARFKVEKGGLRYAFTLKDAAFHDGTPFEARHAKESLERAIRLRTNGFQKFSCIEGFAWFVAGKSAAISGIAAKSKNGLELSLTCASPRLVRALADLRFSVVRSPAHPEIGLGGYRLGKGAEGQVVLEAVAPAAAIRKVAYRKMDATKAKEALGGKEPVALFLHPLGKGDAESLKAAAHVNELNSWKNYMFVINAETVGERAERAGLAGAIDRETLIAACYPGEKLDNNVLPFGFPGYRRGLAFPELGGGARVPSRRLTVKISEGVGNERCVKAELERMLKARGVRATVEISPTETAVQDWIERKVDAMFIYLESEMNLDILQFFAEDSEFKLGPADKRKVARLLKAMNESRDVADYAENSYHAQLEALGELTVLPFFIPRSYFIYSKKILPVHTGMIPPTYLEFSALEVVK